MVGRVLFPLNSIDFNREGTRAPDDSELLIKEFYRGHSARVYKF